MTDFATIQQKIDSGRGKAALRLGQPYTAYRITGASAGDFPTGWAAVETNVSILRRRINERKIESALEYAGTLWYALTADMSDFVLGDVFLCTDAAYVSSVSYGTGATAIPGGSQYELNGFSFCWHMPINVSIGARIDRRARVLRPLGSPDTMADGTRAWRQANDRTTPLVLTGGTYAFGAPGATGSWVPCGLSSTARPGHGDNFPPAVPGMIGFTRYYCHMPYLPGYEPAEGDRIVTEDGARYVVHNPYRQEEGVVGHQLALERTIAQVK